MDFLVIAADAHFKNATIANLKGEKERYISYSVNFINDLFFVHAGRILLALIWGLVNFLIGLLMRPMWATWFLFGNDASLKEYEYLRRKRKKKADKELFGFA